AATDGRRRAAAQARSGTQLRLAVRVEFAKDFREPSRRKHMTLQYWGAIGEMVGALAVVVTLIYLAKQIRLNTHAMDEGRKLALAQTYQMRSDALQAMLVHAADSEHVGPIIIKLTEFGYPEDIRSLDTL